VDYCRSTWYTFVIFMSKGLIHSSFVGMPHYIDTDDIYNGYLVPGGSTVIANLWLAFLRLLNMHQPNIR
jgi:hypothetical protein